MEDKDLERKINATRGAIAKSELSDDHKEALHESLDQAAKSANGSPEKLHDLTVAFCKSVIRGARSDISFKDRVTEAVQKPLDNLRDELIKAVAELLDTHTVSCPMKTTVKQPPTTWKDVWKTAVANPYFCVALGIAAFSPNIVGIVQLFKH
jgi:hypothetical protein